MYHDLIAKSEQCKIGRIVVNLKDLMQEVCQYDLQASSRSRVKHLDPNFIFHESRCGSTLLANVLTYSNPRENRVYSEAAPSFTALQVYGEKFEYCSPKTAESIFRDVIYLMGRVPIEEESCLFFKMQSTATLSLKIVRKAFPRAPWIFLYCNPEEVVVSHFQIVKNSKAKCLQSRQNPSSRVKQYLESSSLDLKVLSHEEYCAIYLPSVCVKVC